MKDTGDTLTVEPSELPAPSSEGATDRPAGGTPAFSRGACLGRYVLLRAIGSGGMGTIFSAYDPELDRKVAIKILHRRLLLSEARPRAEARLLQEARAVARLAHPNVVSVYDVGEAGGCLFITMELVEGRSLGAWLAEDERPWQEVVDIFEKAGRGLAAAHRAGIVHRDFKPGNVMVADDGRVLVVDFGLALHRLPPGTENVRTEDGSSVASPSAASPTAPRPITGTHGSSIPGTPTYMAPEQREGRRVDASADQYSFCVSLYEALYGELPPTENASPDPRRTGEPRPEARRSGIPSRIHQALLRGLRRVPETRFHNLDELLAQIGDPRRQRRRTLTVGIAALLFLGMVAVFLGGSRKEDLCAGGEARLAGVWDPARRAQLGQLILGTDKPYVADLWNTVRTSLDDYARSWQTQYTEACEATHRRGEQSAEMLDRRMACLDERLLEMREVTGLLLAGDPQVLDRSVDAVGSLGRLAACRDRAALLGLPAPLVGEKRQRRLDIQAVLANARALEAAGRYSEVAEVARRGLTEAEAFGDRALIGEAHYWVAMGVGRLGQFDALRDHLLQASQVALASGNDDLLSRALFRLVVSGSLRGDFADAREWAQLAEAAVARLPGRLDLEASYLASLCFMTTSLRRYEEAAEHCRAALDKDPDMPPRQRAINLSNLGIARRQLGRVDEAFETFEASLELIEGLYGDRHPDLSHTLGSLADLYRSRGQFERAQAYLERALAIGESSYGSTNPRLLPNLTGLSTLHMENGRYREAAGYLQRALDIGPPDPAHLALIRFDLASALWILEEDRERALDLAEKAFETLAPIGEPYLGETATVRAWLEERR